MYICVFFGLHSIATDKMATVRISISYYLISKQFIDMPAISIGD